MPGWAVSIAAAASCAFVTSQPAIDFDATRFKVGVGFQGGSEALATVDRVRRTWVSTDHRDVTASRQLLGEVVGRQLAQGLSIRAHVDDTGQGALRVVQHHRRYPAGDRGLENGVE